MRVAAICSALLLGGTAVHGAPPPVALVPDFLIREVSERVATAWRIVTPESASAEDLKSAIAVVSDPMRGMQELTAQLSRLPAGRLLQIPMTGTDRLNMTEIPARFAVCNVHSAVVAIPEYVLAAVLSWNVRLPQLDAEFRRCTWHGSANDCKRAPMHVQTKGQTMGIIGYGALGAGVAQRAAALGMRVVAVSVPTPAAPPPPLAWIGNDTMLPRLMQEADFVVVACPLLPSTRGLVSAEAISHMKPSGVLINVARGPIVDEEGLYQALQKGSIGGAVLDVWWHEDWSGRDAGPSAWPSRFNFSALPNVWMTPHTSYNTEGTQKEALKEMAANFDALARGEPLQNVVRPGAQGFAETATII